MSMEQAILELAAAMREQAAAQRESNEVQRETAAGYERAVTAYGKTFNEVSAADPVQDKAAELAEARTERVAATKEAAAQDAKANEKPAEVKPDAELDKAVEQVEQAALDYKKDVYPVLLQVSKTKGKEALRKLLDQFGAKTGDALKADDFAAILAAGNELLAG